MGGKLTQEDEEVVGLLRAALAKVRRTTPQRERVAGHLESALKCYSDPREGIPPDRLNSANDG